MVVGAFPVAKLGVLAFKQLSKPIANVIKEKAKQSPFFRQYVCMPPAQFYNWVEVKTKMWALNLGRPTGNIPQLNETMAIELGANLLGEFIIFTIGAGVLVFEYIRQANKETKKEEVILMEKQQLQITLNELALHLERQDTQIREMNRTIADLESRRIPNPLNIFKDKKSEPPPPPPASPISSLRGPTTSQMTSNDANKKSFVSGNYDPRHGLIFKALNFIENELFYRDSTEQREPGIIQNALVYLNY